jgi:hypothetical protein
MTSWFGVGVVQVLHEVGIVIFFGRSLKVKSGSTCGRWYAIDMAGLTL